LEPGALGVVCASKPAEFGFDRAVGAAGNRGDRTADLVRERLVLPTPPVPELDALYSPVGLVLAPLSAAYSALTPGHDKLSASQLSECESNLVRTMTVMADQKQLREPLLQAANQVAHRPVVSVDPKPGATSERDGVSTVLEARVEELRLERNGPKDKSFSLHIKARAVLRRVSDGQMLYQAPFEYRSGAGPFADWTCARAFQAVAETGYHDLAKQIADRFLMAAPGGPLLTGAGYRKSPGHVSDAETMLATFRPAAQPVRAVQVSSPGCDPGTLDVFSAATFVPVHLQRPLTKDEAVAEAVSGLDHSLEGMQDSRNLAVQLPACTVAIPLSLWGQAAGLVKGVTDKKLRSAEAQLTAAAEQAQPQVELVQQVAQLLAPRTEQPVVLARYTAPADAGIVERGTALKLRLATPQSHALDGATALQIHVRHAALTGEAGVNPPLALCVEAEATLVRLADGAELYSCPVHYRGEQHKFTQWAARDARLFRQELQRCYREVSATMVNQLVSRGMTSPAAARPPTFADN
jgi:hypothetical protein